MSCNPFDDDNGNFFLLVTDKEYDDLWADPLMSQPGGGVVYREANRAMWTAANGIGPTCGRRVRVRG